MGSAELRGVVDGGGREKQRERKDKKERNTRGINSGGH